MDRHCQRCDVWHNPAWVPSQRGVEFVSLTVGTQGDTLPSLLAKFKTVLPCCQLCIGAGRKHIVARPYGKQNWALEFQTFMPGTDSLRCNVELGQTGLHSWMFETDILILLKYRNSDSVQMFSVQVYHVKHNKMKFKTSLNWHLILLLKVYNVKWVKTQFSTSVWTFLKFEILSSVCVFWHAFKIQQHVFNTLY